MFRSLDGRGETACRTTPSSWSTSPARMVAPLSARSTMLRTDAAYGLAVLLREIAEKVSIYTFSDACSRIPPRRGFALRDAMEVEPARTAEPTSAPRSTPIDEPYDRIIVITDEQSHDRVGAPRGTRLHDQRSQRPQRSRLWPWTHIDGFSEAVIDYIRELEATRLTSKTKRRRAIALRRSSIRGNNQVLEVQLQLELRRARSARRERSRATLRAQTILHLGVVRSVQVVLRRSRSAACASTPDNRPKLAMLNTLYIDTAGTRLTPSWIRLSLIGYENVASNERNAGLLMGLAEHRQSAVEPLQRLQLLRSHQACVYQCLTGRCQLSCVRRVVVVDQLLEPRTLHVVHVSARKRSRNQVARRTITRHVRAEDLARIARCVVQRQRRRAGRVEVTLHANVQAILYRKRAAEADLVGVVKLRPSHVLVRIVVVVRIRAEELVSRARAADRVHSLRQRVRHLEHRAVDAQASGARPAASTPPGERRKPNAPSGG